MNWSRLLSVTQKAEGFSPSPYWDNKQWSWGHGTVAPGPEGTISVEQAAHDLLAELMRAEEDCRALFPAWDEIDGPRQEALVEMLFNLGRTSMLKFRNTLNAINATPPDWEGAAAHALASKWSRQVKGRAVRITEQLRTGEVKT